MPEVAEAPSAVKKPRTNRLLPYLAVFQADVHQTLRSWVYRTWVLLSLLVSVGYLLYRFGAYKEGGLVPSASELMSDLLRWSMMGSITLIIILTAGSISAEVGTLADSVLSRGISRYQYFLGKWHARAVTILGTYFLLGILILAGSIFLLHDENIKLSGCLVALGVVASLLLVVITCGVTVSAIAHSTVLGIAVVWLTLYGAGFALSLMPASWPSLDRALMHLPNILRGLYDLKAVGRLALGAVGTSVAVALVGLVSFSRRDV
jgi:uncharacterized membrane protein